MTTLTELHKIEKEKAIKLYKKGQKVYGIKNDCEIEINKVKEFRNFKEFGINHKNL